MGRSRLIRELNRPVRRIEANDEPRDDAHWPFSIPAVRQLLAEGLDLGSVTVLVGENGSGKSTIVEALAEAYGLNAEGGSTGAMHTTRRSESPLASHLQLSKGATAARGGYFIRAETMHGLFTYLEAAGMGNLHERSHGEAFLELIETRCYNRKGPKPGLYVFDEVESALSFASSLRVLATLAELGRAEGVQLVIATHSPVLSAVPGARILQLDTNGFSERAWEDLELVIGERFFLADPHAYLRRLAD